MDDDWTPMGADPERLAALHEGIPKWLSMPFWEWVNCAAQTASEDGSGLDLLQDYDTRMRLVNPLAPQMQSYELADVIESQGDLDLTFSFVDYLIAELSWMGADHEVADLEEVLRQSGSTWRVGIRNGHPGLERRVAIGVQEAAEAAMATPGHAGTLLSEAWHAAFGASPLPEVAFSKAVKAVEAASIPVVLPADTNATLGKVISKMKADADWTLPLAREHADYPTAMVVIGMMQALWSGQDDRHAGQPNYKPSAQEAGEAAVLLAVPLVHWFTDGTIAHR